MDEPCLYEIRVEGQLGARWSEWLGGMTVCAEGDETILRGVLPDQAALFGLLRRIYDMNLALISVVRLPRASESPAEQGGAIN